MSDWYASHRPSGDTLGETSIDGCVISSRSRGSPSRSTGTTEFENQRLDGAAMFESVDTGNVRMTERSEGPGFALETGDPLGVARYQVGQDLEGDVSSQAAVLGAINLTHSAGAEGRDDFVRAEPVADRKGHAVRRL